MKKFIVLLVLLLTLTSCNEQSSDQQLGEKQEQIMKEANAHVGMPAIVNFQEKKLMKQIFELRDQENLITYTYIVAEQTGKLVFIGKSIGYGLPYATQYTNPEKIINFSTSSYYSGQDPQTIPQADPNGLFMPASANGTWVMLIDKDNKPRPVFIEPNVIVSPFPLSTN